MEAGTIRHFKYPVRSKVVPRPLTFYARQAAVRYRGKGRERKGDGEREGREGEEGGREGREVEG